MKVFHKSVTELDDDCQCPLPLSVIPNYMGINLVSVNSVTWSEQDDGQLVSLTIHFIPASPNDPFRQCKGCAIESEIGTQENPHPVPERFHSCKH
jgi:hypothetical protein